MPNSAEPAARKLSPTEQLIADIVAAGGELRIDRSTDNTNYQVRVASAIRFGKVPDGKLLVMETDGAGRTSSSACRTRPRG